VCVGAGGSDGSGDGGGVGGGGGGGTEYPVILLTLIKLLYHRSGGY
jgi:hypothetical protein